MRDYLPAFPDIELTSEDYELAAEFFNTCRSNGVKGSNTDFLICARESEPVNLAKLLENGTMPASDLLNALQSLSRR